MEYNQNSPLMRQYFSRKQDYKDAIFLLRTNNFYNIFGKDAIAASKILDTVLVYRGTMEFTGFGEDKLEQNIDKLLKNGYKVAYC